MLRVKIELVPFGDESMTKQIAEMVIANAGINPSTGSHKYIGSYADDKGNDFTGLVREHDRSKNVLELLFAMAEQLIHVDVYEEELAELHLDTYMKRLQERNSMRKKEG